MKIRKSKKAEALTFLEEEVNNCTRCKLHTTRFKTVPGEGSYAAKIMFIGEGPGKNEDLAGRPFIGRAGQFLTDIIENELCLSRDEVYICNIVKCRPTVDMKRIKDRPPDEEETAACVYYLEKQIDIIKPLIIVTLGNPATQFITGTTEGITKTHGNWFEYKGIPVMPLYHPSYVIRNGGHKSYLKEYLVADMITLMNKYKELC